MNGRWQIKHLVNCFNCISLVTQNLKKFQKAEEEQDGFICCFHFVPTLLAFRKDMLI